ncbi:hypothetical protein [Verrucomicrobium spinosum]|uniref:hypothetical protein n=1 Tax=Verrucomicrobium spinosum TaxID=2736 RepID=UPI0001745335|nr:hypothetical protein [Verrucomicrobium spinosum]
MQSLSKVQWYGLSFLVLHTIIIAMVYAGTSRGGPWEIKLIQQFFDYPVESLITRLADHASDKVPTLTRWDHYEKFHYASAAIVGGLAYYTLGIAIGFVMTLVAPKTQEDLDLDSQDTRS